MAKRDPTADAISKVAALKSIDDVDRLASELAPLLADKSNYVVARAASLAGERGVRALVPALVDSLAKFMRGSGVAKDPGCEAKLALVRALVHLEAGSEAEPVALEGVRHAHWESTWGGSVDLAIGVRGNCAILLAAMGSKHALRCAAELLAEDDLKPPRERNSVPVRVDAARALTMTNSDAAALLMRYKTLAGDADPNVTAECLAGVLAIERENGLELARRVLNASLGARDPNAEAKAEAALTAIGGSRLQSAFDVLREYDREFLRSPSVGAYLASIALTRQERAIEYLLGLIAEADRETSAEAEKALKPLINLPKMSERIDAAKARR